ncbi:unannotated protein [freshwater metagenome]|uniref:Unannotated protein n=1 Tax=freshwater metagenome TaxID=449393 RepID=A0A6J6CMX4_9ZZZZ
MGSLINKTIAVFDVTLFTTPTKPASDMTVIFFSIPEDEPASMVMVCLNVEFEPRLITFAATTLYPPRPAKSKTPFN